MQKKYASCHTGAIQALGDRRLSTCVDIKEQIHQRTQDNRINTLITPDFKLTYVTGRSFDIMTLNSTEDVAGYSDKCKKNCGVEIEKIYVPEKLNLCSFTGESGMFHIQ
jgi:hypothetical protein